MKKKTTKVAFGKIIFWLFLLVFAWILITRFGQTKNILLVLSAGKWYWVGLAVICQVFYYPAYSQFAEVIFSIFRVDFKWRNVFPIYLASKFTDVALPIASFGQIAVFIRHGKKHNLAPLNVGIGISFVRLFEVIGFIIFSFIIVGILSISGEPRAYLTIPLLILSALMVLLVIFLLQLSVLQIPPNRFILWLIRHIARLGGQKSVTHEGIERIFMEIGSDIKTNSDKILPGLIRTILLHFINLLTLFFVYLAFVGNANVLAILAAYAACLLFTIVSVTPQGVGPAEAVMIATLKSFGIDISTAAVVTLAFRGLLYWLPLFAGFYTFEKLEWDRHHTEPISQKII